MKPNTETEPNNAEEVLPTANCSAEGCCGERVSPKCEVCDSCLEKRDQRWSREMEEVVEYYGGDCSECGSVEFWCDVCDVYTCGRCNDGLGSCACV